MSHSLRSTSLSFACGLLAAALLGCLAGAEGNGSRTSPRYDAASTVGGLVMQIIDHETHTLYHYKRDMTDDVVTYHLMETVDLSLAGQAVIPAVTKTPAADSE